MFSLIVSIVCSLVILSSTVKAQSQELPAQTKKIPIPEAQVLPDLVALLTNVGFNITLQNYPGTRIAKRMVATASSSVSLNTLPSLISYDNAFEHRVLAFTFKVDSSQLSSFKEKFQQFQQKFGSHLNVVQVADGVFKTTIGWTTPELELFKTYFVPLSTSIHIHTVSAFLTLTKVDRARIFYTNLQKNSPKDAEKLKELAKLEILLKQIGSTITINSVQQEMQAQLNYSVNLRNFPELSFYKDKLAFTFIVSPDHFHHVWNKLKRHHREYPPVSPILDGFRTPEGWTYRDLNNFKEEFDSFSDHIYVTQVNASLSMFENVRNSAQSYGIGEKHSPHLYVDIMDKLIGAAKEAIHNPIPSPYYLMTPRR